MENLNISKPEGKSPGRLAERFERLLAGICSPFDQQSLHQRRDLLNGLHIPIPVQFNRFANLLKFRRSVHKP